MDALRRTVATLTARLERSRSKALGRTGTLSVALIVGLSMLFAAAGWLALGRPAAIRDRRERAEAARRERQSAFAHALQFMDSEAETHGLVRRHLQESIPGSQVVVMQRTPGADRLEAATGLDDGHAMAVALSVAEPRACLAVRLGHSETRTASDLLQCPLCGTLGRELTTCTPLLVSGEVIGSVLVAHEEELGEGGRQDVDETVTQAAPVIANMRNLALAEQRAATDALTGLANRRAIQERLRQMFAHAARSEQSLAVVAIDLDHFKQINDRLGHDKGDDVLVAVAHALTHGLRASDFVGRQGGEEFVALLPDTGLDGALAAAENLRCGIAGLHIPGLDRRVTASLGVAVFPEDAAEGDDLLRQADRALYAAKAAGRDRVSAAAGAAFPQPAG